MILGMTTAARLLLLAIFLALTVALLLAVAPLGHTESVTVGSGGSGVIEESTTSLLATEGATVLIPLAIPVLLAGVALACRRGAVSLTIGWLCLAFCVLGAMSVGLFFLPVAGLLIGAGLADRARPQGVLGSTT